MVLKRTPVILVHLSRQCTSCIIIVYQTRSQAKQKSFTSLLAKNSVVVFLKLYYAINSEQWIFISKCML